MAALLTITLLLLCYCAVLTASEAKCDYNVATGVDFTVPLDLGLKELIKIQWKHNNNNVIGGRIRDGKIKVFSGNEKDISSDGDLKLTKVDKTKAGTYTPEVYNTNGTRVQVKDRLLCVLDPVTKASLKVQCGQKPKESQATFTCSVAGQSVQIEWLKNKEVIKNEKASTLKRDGQSVEKDFFSCKVSNAVSSMISNPVTQTCYTSQFGFLYDEVMGVQMWIIIASGGAVVLLLILTIIVCCIMNKRKRRMNLKDEEELRLDWTSTEQQQQHHHHHPHNPNHKHHHHNPPPDHPHHHQQQQQQQHQQQPAGHTGPRQNRSRQQREQRPRLPEPPGSHPQPSPRRAAQGPGPAVNHDDEQPPPLPQSRKNAPQ